MGTTVILKRDNSPGLGNHRYYFSEVVKDIKAPIHLSKNYTWTQAGLIVEAMTGAGITVHDYAGPSDRVIEPGCDGKIIEY